MSRTVKILLAILAGLLGLCLISAAAGIALFSIRSRTVVGNTRVISIAEQVPGQVDGAAAPDNGIAGFILPDGFRQEFGLHVVGLSMVFASHVSGHGHIYLMNVPQAYERLSPADMAAKVQNATDHQSRFFSENVRLTVVGHKPMTIRGQEVVLTESEGTNSEGQPYRELAGVFDGGNGRVLLIMAGRCDILNEPTVDRFVASIQ